MDRASEHLRRARRAYRSPGYPGDLAADLLGGPVPRGRAGRRTGWAAATGGLLVAAAVAAMLRPQLPARTTTRDTLAAAAVPPQASDSSRPAFPGSRWPDRVTLSLPVAPILAATPPVSLSLAALPENLGRLHGSAGTDDWSAKWLENLGRRGIGGWGTPPPRKVDPDTVASTQRSA